MTEHPDDASTRPEELEVDLRGSTHTEPVTAVTACPACGSSMTVDEIDVVGRMARVACGDCGLVRPRRLPSLTQE